ncbi:lipoprotein [Spiroplasma taiwanense]|uniref:Lipoprotein n=1 Tax=Spiroplasma taiwanense CT-1 TaxID=1276220 RepID=S5LUH6_9MOLU|nr:lipoprotein [Spiroplasma taiwanense]AGR41444.1 hypothetical protein STAIW_v1c08580 [Spiroplasma taiwanense CT-1]
MKKLLSLLAVTSLVATSTTSVIACSDNTILDLSSLNWKWDLGNFEVNDDEIINQKYIIKKLAEINKISIENESDIEKLVNIYFDFSSITLLNSTIQPREDEIMQYTAKISSNLNSKIVKRNQTITFKAKVSDIIKAKSPIEYTEHNISGYWYQWETKIESKTLSAEDTLLVNLKDSSYSIINLAYLLSTKNYDTNLDLWLTKENIDYLNTRNKNIDQKKYIAFFGGATGDRMLFSWDQKNDLKISLKEKIDTLNLDGIDLAISGQTLYNRESQETISQAIREVMIEKWLENKNFYLTLSPKLQYLFLKDYERNSASYIPFIESLQGWYEDINVLITNIFRTKYSIIAKETITSKNVNLKKGEIIYSALGAQEPEYFYLIIRSLIDLSWNNGSGYYSLVNKPVRIGLADKYGAIAGTVEDINSETNEPTNIKKH